LIPGHGYPVFGALKVKRMLNDTAEYLQDIYDKTIAMMNADATLDEIIHSVKPRADLAEKPYLQPVYDDPEFIVRNIWRLEGGWYDSDPSNLMPATEAERGREVAELAGGTQKLIARAMERFGAGDLAMASHLIDWAIAAAPDDRAAHEARIKIYEARAEGSASTMAHGVFRSAAVASSRKIGEQPPHNKRSF
jgi:alkyl sulfatase BDS1-like metallo-beta-lactamase superfamily hydrolase